MSRLRRRMRIPCISPPNLPNAPVPDPMHVRDTLAAATADNSRLRQRLASQRDATSAALATLRDKEAALGARLVSQRRRAAALAVDNRALRESLRTSAMSARSTPVISDIAANQVHSVPVSPIATRPPVIPHPAPQRPAPRAQSSSSPTLQVRRRLQPSPSRSHLSYRRKSENQLFLQRNPTANSHPSRQRNDRGERTDRTDPSQRPDFDDLAHRNHLVTHALTTTSSDTIADDSQIPLSPKTSSRNRTKHSKPPKSTDSVKYNPQDILKLRLERRALRSEVRDLKNYIASQQASHMAHSRLQSSQIVATRASRDRAAAGGEKLMAERDHLLSQLHVSSDALRKERRNSFRMTKQLNVPAVRDALATHLHLSRTPDTVSELAALRRVIGQQRYRLDQLDSFRNAVTDVLYSIRSSSKHLHEGMQHFLQGWQEQHMAQPVAEQVSLLFMHMDTLAECIDAFDAQYTIGSERSDAEVFSHDGDGIPLAPNGELLITPVKEGEPTLTDGMVDEAPISHPLNMDSFSGNETRHVVLGDNNNGIKMDATTGQEMLRSGHKRSKGLTRRSHRALSVPHVRMHEDREERSVH